MAYPYHPSQKSLLIDLLEFSDTELGAASSASVVAGQQVISTGVAYDSTYDTFLCLTGPAGADPRIFLVPDVDYSLDVSSGNLVYTLRKGAPFDGTAYFGKCIFPTFIIPEATRLVTICFMSDTLTDRCYYRFGPANRDGLVIGTPSDADALDVPGTPIRGTGTYVIDHGGFACGQRCYMIGSGPSLQAVVQFQ